MRPKEFCDPDFISHPDCYQRLLKYPKWEGILVFIKTRKDSKFKDQVKSEI
jgi:hypothetical protein